MYIDKDPKNYEIAVGLVTWKDKKNINWLKVEKVVSLKYNIKDSLNDLSLFKLEKNLELNENVNIFDRFPD